MITVISGTDRPNSNSRILALQYVEILRAKSGDEEVKFLSLEDLPHNLFGAAMYEKDTISPEFGAIEQEYLIPADRLFFVTPEYNGSFPGVLKYFLDACSIKSKMAIFKGKKAGLAGVATGRAGNLRGLEHLSSILNYMGVSTLPNRLPYSVFDKMLGENNQIVDQNTLTTIEKHALEFLHF